MSQLLVRDIDPEIIQALKRRAAARGHSAEAEHREILRQALFGTPRKSFAEVLAEMPDVGLDSDFERREASEKRDVFD